MKVAILAGGKGSRLTEETQIRPKPMVEIGGKPILWHIMKIYAHFGFSEFIIALGYKGEYIKRYFVDLCHISRDLTVRCGSGEIEVHGGDCVDWTVELIDTGVETMTGGRIKRLAPYLGQETFMLTWGAGVSAVDIYGLLAFHRSHGRLATLNTALTTLSLHDALPIWINGGFFVLEPGVLDYIEGDQMPWESTPLERLARDGQLMAYKHTGFWQCMDTLREKYILEDLWKSGRAPWNVWEGIGARTRAYQELRDSTRTAAVAVVKG
jgi:glucose-1-phosphate cytidylyltransferase